MQSASGISSRISSAIVALPARTAFSAPGWMKCAPAGACGHLWVTMTSHHSEYGTLMTVAPRLRIASSLVSGAISGTTTVQAMPCSAQHQASPCAKLPAEAVLAPTRRSVSLSSIHPIAFAAGRTLKEPTGWRFSSLSQIWAPSPRSWLRRTSGVRIALLLMLSAATRISESVGARSVGSEDMGAAIVLQLWMACKKPKYAA